MPKTPLIKATVTYMELQIVPANEEDRLTGLADEEDSVMLLVGTALRSGGRTFNFELKFRTDADLTDNYTTTL